MKRNAAIFGMVITALSGLSFLFWRDDVAWFLMVMSLGNLMFLRYS